MNTRRSRTPFLALTPLVLALAACAGALLGCASTQLPSEAAELSAPKLVQRAQEAADKGNYLLAIEYYRAVQERFPDEVERSLWAAYEIAFLNHKMGRDEEAIALFDELLREYETRGDADLPQGPRSLAQKVRDRIAGQ